MADEWIEKLAGEMKERNREAAEKYGRDQHYAGIVAERGGAFFAGVVTRLEENVAALRSRLQGDATAAAMAMDRVDVREVRITRERFPWVDATLAHRDDTIVLDYAKGAGVGGDLKVIAQVDRTTQVFALRAGVQDGLYAEEAFSEKPGQYDSPEDLARRITEILFAG